MDAKIMEIEGKSIDEAIEKACREFGVAREKLNIEIISEETGGFLGMLSKKKRKSRLLYFLWIWNFHWRTHPVSRKKKK